MGSNPRNCWRLVDDFVVGTGLLFLATLTRYPGVFAARSLQFIVGKPEQPMTGAGASSGRTRRCAC
jgi:hypothetical protein